MKIWLWEIRQVKTIKYIPIHFRIGKYQIGISRRWVGFQRKKRACLLGFVLVAWSKWPHKNMRTLDGKYAVQDESGGPRPAALLALADKQPSQRL